MPKQIPHHRGYVIDKEFWVSREFFTVSPKAHLLAGCLLGSFHPQVGCGYDPAWIRSRFMIKAKPSWCATQREVEEYIEEYLRRGVLVEYDREGVSYLKFKNRDRYLGKKVPLIGLDGIRDDGRGCESPPQGNSQKKTNGPAAGQTWKEWAREKDRLSDQEESVARADRAVQLQQKAEQHDGLGSSRSQNGA